MIAYTSALVTNIRQGNSKVATSFRGAEAKEATLKFRFVVVKLEERIPISAVLKYCD